MLRRSPSRYAQIKRQVPNTSVLLRKTLLPSHPPMYGSAHGTLPLAGEILISGAWGGLSSRRPIDMSDRSARL